MRATRITAARSTFEREPLIQPFGFKGGYLTELWQNVTALESASGHEAIGLATQSVLWSDPRVFAAHTEAGGNALMYAVSDFALRLARDRAFETPLDLLQDILPEVRRYAAAITGLEEVRTTFILNALVALDQAAWLLHAAEKFSGGWDASSPPAHETAGSETDSQLVTHPGQGSREYRWDRMIPPEFRPAFARRHDRLAAVPAVGYGATTETMEQLAADGFFVIKVKLGGPGPQDEMLAFDCRRLDSVHEVFGRRETNRTASGRILYYLDLNGRYESRSLLERLIDHAAKIGARDHILLIEEPFPEGSGLDVSGLGLTIAADESAHTDTDVRALIDLGYGAIALKPIAKTLSMTLRIAKVAHEAGVPCFCADLTGNPILVEWNKAVAARLAPLPGLDTGLLETNGHQNYRHWDQMSGYLPDPDASWTRMRDGVFELGEEYYKRDGDIFELSAHYRDLVRPEKAR